MEVDLRHQDEGGRQNRRRRGRAADRLVRSGMRGLGQSGEVDVEGGGLTTGTLDPSSAEFDPSTLFPAPGSDIISTVPFDIIPAGDPSGVMTGSVPPLSSSQLAQSIAAGTVVLARSLSGAAGTAARNCPSGYATPAGQCVQIQGQGQPLIAGISNQTLAIVGVAFVALMMMGSGGGRRR